MCLNQKRVINWVLEWNCLTMHDNDSKTLGKCTLLCVWVFYSHSVKTALIDSKHETVSKMLSKDKMCSWEACGAYSCLFLAFRKQSWSIRKCNSQWGEKKKKKPKSDQAGPLHVGKMLQNSGNADRQRELWVYCTQKSSWDIHYSSEKSNCLQTPHARVGSNITPEEYIKKKYWTIWDRLFLIVNLNIF